VQCPFASQQPLEIRPAFTSTAPNIKHCACGFRRSANDPKPSPTPHGMPAPRARRHRLALSAPREEGIRCHLISPSLEGSYRADVPDRRACGFQPAETQTQRPANYIRPPSAAGATFLSRSGRSSRMNLKTGSHYASANEVRANIRGRFGSPIDLESRPDLPDRKPGPAEHLANIVLALPVLASAPSIASDENPRPESIARNAPANRCGLRTVSEKSPTSLKSNLRGRPPRPPNAKPRKEASSRNASLARPGQTQRANRSQSQYQCPAKNHRNGTQSSKPLCALPNVTTRNPPQAPQTPTKRKQRQSARNNQDIGRHNNKPAACFPDPRTSMITGTLAHAGRPP